MFLFASGNSRWMCGNSSNLLLPVERYNVIFLNCAMPQINIRLNSALACIMPKEEGVFSGGATQPKFWYNSATNNCEQLFYNGAGGNANNFESRAQCESYCKTGKFDARMRFVSFAFSLDRRSSLFSLSSRQAAVWFC